MRILSLHLTNYKRFLLTGIKEITLDTESLLQLILGTNGSGKSSLLAEATPLPANGNDYESGGIKIIVLEHRGSTYTLRSDIARLSKHSFIKDDGENLNPGGTSTVQRELIVQELGFTVQLQDLLTGKTTFCSMSPAKRREWITSLSSVDLTYATGVFQSMRSSVRDVQGAMRLNKERLVRESSKLLDLEKITELQTRATRLNEDLVILTENKEHNIPSVTEIENRIRSDSKELIDITTRLLTTATTYSPDIAIKNFDDLEDAINVLFGDEHRYRALIESNSDELLNINNVISSMIESGAMDLEGLHKRIGTLYEQRATCDSSSEQFTFNGDLDITLADTDSVWETLNNLVLSIPLNVRPDFDNERYNSAKGNIVAGDTFLNKINNVITKVQNRIELINSSIDSECPSCKYVWKPGVSDNELRNLQASLDEHLSKKDEMVTKLKVEKEIVEQFDVYTGYLRRFRSIVESYPRLDALWNEVIKQKYLDTTPTIIMETHSLWKRAVLNAKCLAELDQEIKEVEQSINHLGSLETTDVSGFQSRKIELENIIEDNTLSLERTVSSLKYLKVYKNNMRNYVDVVDRCSILTTNIERQRDLLIRAYRQEMIEVTINKTQSSLAVLQTSLNEKDTLAGIVNDLKYSVTTLETDFEAWSILGDILSPSNGIIAEQMIGFIDCMTSQMNDVIEKIWEYDLQILSCSNDAGELDYKFPLLVKNKNNVVKDISNGSTAQQDIVNFAFTMMVMFYKDLQDYPLYLDETGASFDTAHRFNLMRYVKHLLDTNQCSQIYLVNHYSSEIGGISNADVCVLDPTNITVPSAYNQHVTIIYGIGNGNK